MTEEENKSVETENVEAAAPATESDNVQERQETAEDRKKRNDVEYNWAEARRKMQEQDRVIKELSDNINRMKQPAKAEDDGLDKLADDDIVTAGHAKKLAMKMAKQAAEQAIRERELATLEDRMRQRYSDFDQVTAPENIELLKKQKPELFASVLYNPDPNGQAVALYDALKMIGVASNPQLTQEKEKAIKNAQKPLSVNAVSKQSAIGNAHLFENGLTPELKKSLWSEMQAAMKHA